MALRIDASYKSSTVLPTIKLDETEGIIDPTLLSGVHKIDETQTNIQIMQCNSDERKAKQAFPINNVSLQTSEHTI